MIICNYNSRARYKYIDSAWKNSCPSPLSFIKGVIIVVYHIQTSILLYTR